VHDLFIADKASYEPFPSGSPTRHQVSASPYEAGTTTRYGQTPVHILVTNDDGVESPGIRVLTVALAAAGHDVVVVAPTSERSGTGASIGLMHRSNPIPCRTTSWPELPKVPVHAIDAPPAAATYVGCLGAFGPRPDIVVSGINRGANTGHLVIHSGTVGAALTAAALGLPAIAVSLAFDVDLHWETAAAVATAAVPWTAERSQPPRLLNINTPTCPLIELRGVQETVLAPYQELWETHADPYEVRLEYVGRGADPPDGTDVAALRAGYASVTQLSSVSPVPSSDAATAIAALLG